MLSRKSLWTARGGFITEIYVEHPFLLITVEQIKAARALLKWKQDDLAKASGISKPAIANIERGHVRPREDTAAAIKEALEHAGVEFTAGPGVRLMGERLNVVTFEGSDAVFRLMDDISQTLENGHILRANGIDERRFAALGEERVRRYLEQWNSKKIQSRLLLKTGDTYILDRPEHYRWVGQNHFSPVPWFTYLNKCGMILWQPVQRVLIIDNPSITASYRQQFDRLWEKADIFKS